MQTLFADTNIFIRFLIGDNQKQLNQVKKYFQKADKEQLEIKVISQIVPEIEYVLKGVYKISRSVIAEKVLALLKTEYLEFEDRELWIETFEVYQKIKVDVVDIFLFLKSRREQGKVLTFDQDLEKLRRAVD